MANQNLLLLGYLHLDKEIAEEVKQVSENLFRLTYHWGLRPNTLLLRGKEANLLVDPGQRPMVTRLKKAIGAIQPFPVDVIINTHPHGDHISANEEFRNFRLINSDNLEGLVSEKFVRKVFFEKKSLLRGISEYSYVLDYEEQSIIFIKAGGIHSVKDVLVWFKNENVVHMGDLLLTQSFPAVGYRVKEYLKFLTQVISAFPLETTFVGGHGRELSQNGLIEYKDMLEQTILVMKAKVKEGYSLADMQRDDILKPWEEYASYIKFIDKDFWLDSIYKSYEGHRFRWK